MKLWQMPFRYLHKRAHNAIVIVENNKPVGIVTEEDCAGVDRFTQLHSVMSKDLMTLPDTADAHAAFDFLHHHRRKLAPVVSANWRTSWHFDSH